MPIFVTCYYDEGGYASLIGFGEDRSGEINRKTQQFLFTVSANQPEEAITLAKKKCKKLGINYRTVVGLKD